MMDVTVQQASTVFGRQLPVRECFRQQVLMSFTTFLDTEASLAQIPVNLRDLAEDDAYRSYLMQQSHVYREHLDALKNQLSELAEVEDKEGSTLADSLLDLFDRVDAIEKIWHLAEVFLLNADKYVNVDFAAWLQKYCLFDFEADIALFKDDSHPELHSVYWNTVFSLAAIGRLDQVRRCLSMHSELKLSSMTGSVGFGGSRAGADRQQVDRLMEICFTHPFAQLLSPSVASSSSHRNQDVHALQRWQDKVRMLRDSSSLALRIPELDTLLMIFLGEQHVLDQYHEQQWTKATLAQLLYVYPALLARANVCRVVEEHAKKFLKPGNNMDNVLYNGLSQLMIGNVGGIMQTMYHFGVKESKGVREFCVTCLQAAIHLSRLLLAASVATDLSLPLVNGPNGVSFVEELALEVAQTINSLSLPLPLVVEYSSLCPSCGPHFLRSLLTHRLIQHDEEAVMVAEQLKNLGFETDASRVLASRGTLWLKKGMYTKLRRSVAENRLHFGTIPPTFSTYGKAAYFYQLAGQYNRIQLLLESSLYRCMEATTQSSYFTELQFRPSPPVYPPASDEQRKLTAEQLAASHSVYDDVRDSEVLDWDMTIEQEFRRKPTLSKLTTGKESTEDQCARDLEHALFEAASLIGAIDEVDEVSWSEHSIVSQLIHDLKAYIEAIKIFLRAQLSTNTLSNTELRIAAAKISSILVPDLNNAKLLPNTSIRHWLHLLELATFFHTTIGHLEVNQSLDADFLQALENDHTHILMNMETKLQWCRGVYAVKAVEQFVQLLDIIDSSEEANWIFTITGATKDRLASLRTKLDGLHNTMKIVQKIEQEEEQRRQELEEMQRRIEMAAAGIRSITNTNTSSLSFSSNSIATSKTPARLTWTSLGNNNSFAADRTPSSRIFS